MLSYKYDALTDCAAGADILRNHLSGLSYLQGHLHVDKKKYQTFPHHKRKIKINIPAPEEARNSDLGISLSLLTYKHDEVTNCATGADILGVIQAVIISVKTLLCLEKEEVLCQAFTI